MLGRGGGEVWRKERKELESMIGAISMLYFVRLECDDFLDCCNELSS